MKDFIKKRYSAVIFSALVVVLAGGYVVSAFSGDTPKIVVEGNYIEAPTTIVPPQQEELGAAPGPDIYYPYLSINDVMSFYDSKETLSGTSTVCAIKSPNATSTLDVGSVYFRGVATSTATVISIAKSATAFATTTLLGADVTIGAGAQGYTIASTTSATYANQYVFAPNQYFVVGVKGITAGQLATENIDGTCQVKFTRITK